MRRLQAIVLVIALLLSPMALLHGTAKRTRVPFYCAMILWREGACVVRQGHCMDSAPAFRRDSAQFGPRAVLAPWMQMLLPRLFSRPALRLAAANTPALAFAVPRGFLPSPFHPPRA